MARPVLIPIDDYRELSLLAWSRHERTIPAREALALYEAYWRFVDVQGMSERERRLIDDLAREYGNGVLNV